MSLSLLFLVVAIILAILAAIPIPGTRVSLGWLSLAFFEAAFAVGGLQLSD